MQPIYMRTHTTSTYVRSMHTYASSMRMHTHPKNPNLENYRTKTLNQKTNNQTCSEIHKEKLSLNKHIRTYKLKQKHILTKKIKGK